MTHFGNQNGAAASGNWRATGLGKRPFEKITEIPVRRDNPEACLMTTFILIHGAFHGGWCWEPVTPYLERRGHRVLTPDLPGHGSDQTPQSDATFSLAVARVAKVAA